MKSKLRLLVVVIVVSAGVSFGSAFAGSETTAGPGQIPLWGEYQDVRDDFLHTGSNSAFETLKANDGPGQIPLW